MTSTYSFGEDSPIKFTIPDKMAQHYNEAVETFLKAHRRFTQKYGRRWDPMTDPVVVKWNRQQQKAWNVVAEMYNELTGGNDHEAGPFHPLDFQDDYLVKNAASAVAVASNGWGGTLTLAVWSGALYGLLRGR